MKIRSIIMLLTVPLFLAIVAVNGALLYFQQKAEMSRALGDQALAAAVVTAEFISAMEDPQRELAKPLRRQAIDAASRQIVGLQGIYLVEPGKSVMPLMTNAADWTDWVPPSSAFVAKAHISRATGDLGESRFIAALAPAGRGRFVAARIDAEPMFAQIEDIKRAILWLVLGTSMFAAGLGWFVARHIGRELRINGQSLAVIGAGDPLPIVDGLRIRETRDLADAVRLMGASDIAAEIRHRRVIERNDRKRDFDQALDRSRALLFQPVERNAGGARIALRICGEAHPGAFFALVASDDGASAVIGWCKDHDSVTAFAQAAAARRFIEANLIEMGTEDCLSLARDAYRIDEMESIAWRSGEPMQRDGRLLCIADTRCEAAAKRYVAENPGATPDQWLEGIEVLIAPSGIFVAIGISGSAKCGEGT